MMRNYWFDFSEKKKSHLFYKLYNISLLLFFLLTVYVAEQMDPDDPSFLEALEKETEILRKRVDACKSHIMLITCFDTQFKSGQLSNVINHSRMNQTINITYTNTDLN